MKFNRRFWGTYRNVCLLLASCWFLPWLIFLQRRWMGHVPPYFTWHSTNYMALYARYWPLHNHRSENLKSCMIDYWVAVNSVCSYVIDVSTNSVLNHFYTWYVNDYKHGYVRDVTCSCLRQFEYKTKMIRQTSTNACHFFMLKTETSSSSCWRRRQVPTKC
jgi:hypothetical protein